MTWTEKSPIPTSSALLKTQLKMSVGVGNPPRSTIAQVIRPRPLSLQVFILTEASWRQCLLLALGESKAQAVRDAIEGPVTAQVTASALQLHRDVIAVVDEAAAAKLERRDYYLEVERAQSLLQEGKWSELGITSHKQQS